MINLSITDKYSIFSLRRSKNDKKKKKFFCNHIQTSIDFQLKKWRMKKNLYKCWHMLGFDTYNN